MNKYADDLYLSPAGLARPPLPSSKECFAILVIWESRSNELY